MKCDIPFAPAERQLITAATSMADVDFRIAADGNHHQARGHDDLGDAEVLISHWPPKNWARARELRWMQTDSAGVDYLAGDEIWRREVVLTNAAGAYATQIGQYVVGYVLSIAEKHRMRGQAQGSRSWPAASDTQMQMIGLPLRGQRVVVVGYGGIGREVGRLAVALGMNVVAIKANPDRHKDESFCIPGTGDPDGTIPTSILGIEALPEAVADADFVVLTLPLTDQTRGLVNARLLASMRPSAWIVNVARGAIIDHDALIEALGHSQLGGAILDVFDPEPLPPDSALWGLENVVVTPHVAGGGTTSRELFAHLVAENLRRYAAQDDLVNVVDRTRRY